MQAWSDGTCETDGVRIHYVCTGGRGEPVVLLHGLMGSGACWTPLATALESKFNVVMPDARGHGSSTGPDSGYRYDEHASDILAVVRHLRLRRPVFVGHSMGAMTAAVAAQRCADNLRGLVLVDPTFLSLEIQQQVWESDVADQHRRALGLSRSELLVEHRARHPHRPSEILEVQVEARLNTRLSALGVLKPPNPDFRALVHAIEVPTLLVIGDFTIVSPELATELSIINPRVAVEQIPSAGHGLPFDQPRELERLVASFLRAAPNP